MHRIWICFFLLIGIAGHQKGIAQDSLYLDALIDSLELVPDQSDKIDLSLKIAETYVNSDFSRALEYSNIAIDLAEESFPEKYFKAQYIKAYIYFLMRRLDSALVAVNSIIIRKEDVEDPKLVMDAFSLLGSIQHRSGDNISARKTLMETFRRQKEAQDSMGLAATLNRIGLVWFNQATYDSAVSYFIESRRIAELCKDSIGMIKALGNLGKTYFSMERYKTSRFYFQEVFEIVEATGNKRYEGAIYINLGAIYQKEGVLDSAEYYYKRTLEIYQAVNNRLGEANVYLNLGGVYDQKKQYEVLLEQSQKALSIYEQMSNTRGIIKARTNIALYYERIKQYDRALILYDSVLHMAYADESPEEVLYAYYNIYKLYEKVGNFREAFKYQTIHNQVKDSIINLEKEKAIADLELKYEREKDQSEILHLKNETLSKDLQLRHRTQERNLITFVGIALAIGIVFLILLGRQKIKKDRIIRNKEIERLKEEKKALSARSLVEGQEEERRRVAQELHDGIGVLLSSVKMQFSRMEEKTPENKALLKRATDMLERASGDVRQISHNLMPGNLAKFGLFDALEDLFESVTESGMIKAEFDVEGPDRRLPENHEIMLYRIVQELINNTLKHANAGNISLWIKNEPDNVILKYADNGQGFNVEKAQQKGTMGLKSIRSRVDFLEGELDMESGPGKGSSFYFQIPIKQVESNT